MKKIKESLLAALLLGTCSLTHAQVTMENYESETVGAGTYSGAWDYIYAGSGLGTTVTSLNIRNGSSVGGGETGSPASGNYLEYETATGTWGGDVYSDNATPFPWTTNTFTTDAWESPAGHLHRREMLDAGATYAVSLWRRIALNGVAGTGVAFSVWDGSTVNTVTPFLSTPGSLLTMQSYDMETGGWQQVSLTFTAPGSLGSGAVPVDFMMGLYAPTEVSPEVLAQPDWDGNTSTLDTPTATHQLLATGVSYTQSQSLAMDGFSVTSVPEPSVTILGAIGTLLLTRRRTRSRTGA